MIENNGLRSVNARRRWFAAGVGLPAWAWMGGLRAQANPPVVIGWLGTGSREGSLHNARGAAWLLSPASVHQ